MTGHEYLEAVLTSQTVADTTDMQAARANIEQCLRTAYGSTPRIYYAGSYGKDTMIKAAYDLDLVIYFPSDTTTLKNMYWGVYNVLNHNKYVIEPKDVALRLPYTAGYHIDVVPGRYIDDSSLYANLYRRETDSRLQTSIKIHIDTIRNSGVRGTIKLIKLWNVRHRLGVRSFALELLTIEALKRSSVSGYDNKVWTVLQFLRENIQTIRLVDPANSANVISDLITPNIKAQIARQAQLSLQQQYWGQIIW